MMVGICRRQAGSYWLMTLDRQIQSMHPLRVRATATSFVHSWPCLKSAFCGLQNKFVEGVSTAVLQFLRTFRPQNSIVPFLVTANKLYLTHATHAQEHRAVLERDPTLKHCQSGSHTIAGLSSLRLDDTKRSFFNYDCQLPCRGPCVSRAVLRRAFS